MFALPPLWTPQKKNRAYTAAVRKEKKEKFYGHRP